MQAIILAAGMGRRLKELTQNNTKCMVRVNGVTLIERVLRQLDALHLSRIVIVIGYEGKKLTDYVATLDIQTQICFVNNPIYDKTNNIYSLSLASDYLLLEDTLLLESDLIFDDDVLHILMDDPRDTLALVDKYESWMDGTCIKIGEDDFIKSFISAKDFDFNEMQSYYKTVNIYKFSRHFSESYYVPFLKAYSTALGLNEYYEQVLRVITMLDEPVIRAKKLSGQVWYEIDDIADLDIASSLFAHDDAKVASIQSRYGGYWRYPKVLDFCYLVNPYFPPQKLLNEIKANFEVLISQYPSGMAVNSLLAAKNFGIRQEHILVGNGAAELIKAFMGRCHGKVGFIRPTFEEYPNRYNKEMSVVFTPQNNDLIYTLDDIIKFFSDKDISTLILINPDNPTGNYLKHDDVLKLVKWCDERQLQIAVDESFVDFAEEKDATLINEKTLAQFNNLIVVKSISKSYGVPGLRLGVIASANETLIKELKKDVAIWNINSFGEFYLQIEEKYKKNYAVALDKFKKVRSKFVSALSAIPALRVIPSQANYVMVEIKSNISSKELTKKLLLKYNILIKDLSSKVQNCAREYVRIAVRSAEDNEKLVKALNEIFSVAM